MKSRLLNALAALLTPAGLLVLVAVLGSSFLAIVLIPGLRLAGEVAQSSTALKLAGEQHSEGIALWAGYQKEDVFLVTNLVIPRQTGYRGDDGVCAVIEGPELRRIGLELYKAGRQLFAQIHSHPTDAYHSATDDEYAIVTTMGGLSLVVPDFAIRPFDLDEYATYRLSEKGSWEEISLGDVSRLIQIVEA